MEKGEQIESDSPQPLPSLIKAITQHQVSGFDSVQRPDKPLPSSIFVSLNQHSVGFYRL